MRTAVVLFVYNRPRHLSRTLAALTANHGIEHVDLRVFSDGPRTEADVREVQEVRRICRGLSGFLSVKVTEREENLGLARSIRTGVTDALADRDAVVVLEDDLITHPSFLRYLTGALEAYREDERVMSVSAYMPPRILMPRSLETDVWLSVRNLSYGWGIWKDRWESVNWELPCEVKGFEAGGADLPYMLEKQQRGETDSWAIGLSYAHFREQRFSVLPRDSYVKPIGLDGSGVHCRPSPLAWLSTTRHAVPDPEFPERLEVDEAMQNRFRTYYDWQFRVAQVLGRV
jgi:hypothetical protein